MAHLPTIYVHLLTVSCVRKSTALVIWRRQDRTYHVNKIFWGDQWIVGTCAEDFAGPEWAWQKGRENSEWNFSWTDVRILCHCLRFGKKGWRETTAMQRSEQAAKWELSGARSALVQVLQFIPLLKNVLAEGVAEGKKHLSGPISHPHSNGKLTKHLIEKNENIPREKQQQILRKE